MALFVDGPSVTVDDLLSEDSGLLDVSKTCGINATTKIALTHDDLATDLNLLLEKVNAGATAGQTLTLEQVVVTTPLKKWETFLSLTAFYRDAWFSQIVDRYQGKWQEYTRLAQIAGEKFVASGIGFVSSPVVRAGVPVLGSVAGPQKGGIFYAVVTWVNTAGQEGQPSEAASLTVMDGNLMTVTAMNPPPNAVGFHVYAGPLLSGLFRQTDTPLPAGLAFTYVPGQMSMPRLPGAGQTAEFYRSGNRMMLRG